MSDTWNDRIREAVKISTAKIPYVGFVVSSIVVLFWPEDGVDVWSLVKEQTEAMIDQKILEKELETCKSDLESISEYLDMYRKFETDEDIALNGRRSNAAKASYLSDAIQYEVQCFNRFKNTSNAHLIIPLTVTLSHLHLACLRELYQYGSLLYKESGEQARINTQYRLKDLCDKYIQYKELLKSSFKKWLTYRESKISVEFPFHAGPIQSADMIVNDALTGERIKYSATTNKRNFFEPLADAVKRRMINQTTSDFISQYLSATFCLSKYLPAGLDVNKPFDFSGDPSVSQTTSDYLGYEKLKYGPFSPATVGVSHRASWKPETTDKPGVLKSIMVREYNSIDALQFLYADHNGNVTGNPKGGEPHTVNCNDGHVFTGMKLRFANGLACSVELLRYDTVKGAPGQSSGVLGNRSGWKGTDVTAEINGEWYRLCGGSFASYTGPSSTIGLGYIELEFTATKK